MSDSAGSYLLIARRYAPMCTQIHLNRQCRDHLFENKNIALLFFTVSCFDERNWNSVTHKNFITLRFFLWTDSSPYSRTTITNYFNHWASYLFRTHQYWFIYSIPLSNHDHIENPRLIIGKIFHSLLVLCCRVIHTRALLLMNEQNLLFAKGILGAQPQWW